MATDDDAAVEEEEDISSSVGFMFDACLTKVRRTFDVEGLQVSVLLVDDNPGHVQSGHYLWPGGLALAKHLVSHLNQLPHARVLELGAGAAGLPGFSAWMMSPGCKQVILTDHDPGVVEILKENICYLKDERAAKAVGDASAAPAALEAIELAWGEMNYEAKASLGLSQCDGCQLLLGADVIYDTKVVEPLFRTISDLLPRHEHGLLLMSQSFGYEEQTEDEISRCCESYGLVQEVLDDALASGGSRLRSFCRLREKKE